MKEKGQIMRKASSCSSQCDSSDDEFMETEQTDRELYLFMRGGFGAK